MFVWPEGELGELSHPPPACPGGTPRAMNEVCQKYLGPKIPKVRGFAIALLAKASDCFVFPPEITMPKINLSGMSVEALMDLRKRVDETLHKRRAELGKQLERLGRAIAVVGGARVVGGGGSALKGRKVPPKYRGPSGETWAGRGARPRWPFGAFT